MSFPMAATARSASPGVFDGRRVGVYAVAIALSVALHCMFWHFRDVLERRQEIQPETKKVIEVTLTAAPGKPPEPISQPGPPAVPAAPAKAKPPEVKKAVPKPLPPPPKPKPMPESKPRPKQAVVPESVPPQTEPPPAPVQPSPRPAAETPANRAAETESAGPPAGNPRPEGSEAPSGKAGGSASAGKADSEVVTLYMPEPAYPRFARDRRWEGVVTVGFLAMPDGRPERVVVVSGSGHDALDEAAVEAVKKARFKVTSANGQPVACTKKIRFTLK